MNDLMHEMMTSMSVTNSKVHFLYSQYMVKITNGINFYKKDIETIGQLFDPSICEQIDESLFFTKIYETEKMINNPMLTITNAINGFFPFHDLFTNHYSEKYSELLFNAKNNKQPIFPLIGNDVYKIDFFIDNNMTFSIENTFSKIIDLNISEHVFDKIKITLIKPTQLQNRYQLLLNMLGILASEYNIVCDDMFCRYFMKFNQEKLKNSTWIRTSLIDINKINEIRDKFYSLKFLESKFLILQYCNGSVNHLDKSENKFSKIHKDFRSKYYCINNASQINKKMLNCLFNIIKEIEN